MYHFVQFRPDKKESWRLLDEKQLPGLEKRPAFITILSVDQDPEILAEAGEDALDHVRYFGPMYWDFDGPEIDPVLDDVRSLLDWLMINLEIPKQFIHCWLSGQKGVHVTVPPQVFGVKSPTKALPWIWKEVALQHPSATLDLGVYSAGRGRMWRCEGIKRPGKGTYKVGVSVEELKGMDADQYEVLVASPRPPLSKDLPSSNVLYPKAQSLLKAAKTTASKKLRALKSQTSVPLEVLQGLEEVPGCILKLITSGDCVESNWNQAAMQLAAYIGAKYTREDEQEFTSDLIDPFITNVSSSSRPSEKERLSHVKEQLNRAFSGRLKFTVGPLISAIGSPCGSCAICRQDITKDLTKEDEATFCQITKVKSTPAGFFLVGENSSRQLTSFTFKAHTEVRNLETTDDGYVETQRTALIGTLTDDIGASVNDFELSEKAWASRRDLLASVSGRGTSSVHCSDAEAQKLLRAILTFSGNQMQKITKTPVCGIILERSGKKNVIPHYVEAGGSYTQHNTESRFYYDGNPQHSPTLFEEEFPYKDDTELESTIKNMLNSNTPEVVAAAVGWTVACHFREHIQMVTNQFPLLNLSGGAGAGKSSFASLILNLGGIDYSKVDFINVETSTVYPLVRFVTSSTTVPRLVEEVNPAQLTQRAYGQVLGILKAGWNRAAIPRGYINSSKSVNVTADKVSSPIVFASEQPPSVPALRSRSLEVRLASKTLTDPVRVKAYKAAFNSRECLQRMAKALVTKALNTSPKEVMALYDNYEDLVPDSLGQRPKFSYQTALVGLDLFIETCKKSEVDVCDELEDIKQKLLAHLDKDSSELSVEKNITEVDKLLSCLDSMAGEPENQATGLRPGIHYWRTGPKLSLVLPAIFPRYLRFIRSVGDRAVIVDPSSLSVLLNGEVYFSHTDSHPTYPELRVHVIDIKKLSRKGTILTNFQDGTEPDE